MGLISRVSSRTYRYKKSDFPTLHFLKMASKAFRSFVPFFDRVLIQKSEAVTKTASGLIIPDKAQAKINTGTVVAHGAGKEDAAINVSVGDKVLLPEFGGSKIELGGEEFQIFRNSELIGKFEE